MTGTSSHYDVIVVGARCAGASTAMLLARKGLSVLLVDRATFPSDIAHGHLIHKHGPGRLASWGLLDRVVATNCPPITSLSVDLGDFPLVGTDLAVDGVAFGYGPRRSALDNVLVEAAVEAGAELREGVVVEEFLREEDQVTGIRGRDRKTNSSFDASAAITVGADGRHSRLARAVNAPEIESFPTLTGWYFSYWSGVPGDALEVAVRNRRVFFSFPTNDALYAVFVAWALDIYPRDQSAVDNEMMAAIDLVPELAERVRGGRREERIYGAADLPNVVRKPYGPGWALVGDAGCHKDPWMALGVCDAFRDAELLSDAIYDGMAGKSPLETSLASFEQRRNQATLPDFDQNLAAAQFIAPPPDVMRLRAALRGNPEATRHFHLVFEGLMPPESFFNPRNMHEIMESAAVRAS